MAIKFVLNILYNICIFVLLWFIYSSIKSSNWAYVLGGAFLCGMIIIFKPRLIKDVKNLQKKP